MNLSTTYICLLDTPSIIENSAQKRLQLRYRKALGLLGYLAAEPNRNHSRAFLSSLFWPDFDEPTARLNLRQTLAALTKLFNQSPCSTALEVNREFLALHNHPQMRFDIQDLEHPDNLENLILEESLLTGVFMAGYSLADCDEFEIWLEDKRSYYRRCQVKLLTQLLSQAQTKHKSDQVINFATKLLKIDPDNESLLCEAMRLCSDFGQPQLSLKLYEHFNLRMERDLGVSPNATSQALYKKILQLSQAAVTIPSHANQFPAVEKISPVIVVHLQWQCHLKDPEAIAQSLYDADHYARKVLCSEIHAFHLSSAGRGAFFYFGWPKALDDNAWIAIRGVLRLMHYSNSHADLELRAGIHCGLLLSSLKASIPDLLGDITEETSLLCQSANNGQALMSESCYQLVKKRVKAHKLIEHRRKIDGNIQASYLLTDVQEWLDRDEIFYYPELKKYHQSLDECFSLAIESNSAILAYTQSSAGSGKSSQVNSWLTSNHTHVHLIKLLCYPDRQGYPLFPVIGYLRQLLGLQHDQTISSQAIEDYVSLQDWNSDSDLSNLIEMIASDTPLSRQKIELIFNDLITLIHHFKKQCTVIWVEDGHWIDEATFYFLAQLPSRANKPILVIMTARQLPYSGQFTHWKSLPILKPSVISATQMIRHFNQNQAEPLSLDRIETILTLSDHNPFLMKNLARYEQQNTPLSVQHYFSFLIDQMGSLRDQVLQQSLQPYTYKKDKLKPISPLLAQTLASLTPSTHLNHIHRTIAEDILKKYRSKEIEYTRRAELAEHWFKCNELTKAANQFAKCANHAIKTFSYSEASNYLGRLIKIDDLLQKNEDQQLANLINFANCRIQAYGYNDKHALNAASKALKMCQASNTNHYLFQSLVLSFITIDGNDKGPVKLEYANFLLQMADTDEKRCIAHWALAHSYFIQQDFTQSRKHAKESIDISSINKDFDTLVFFPENITINCLIIIGLGHYLDNNPKSAMECVTKMLDIEKESKVTMLLSDYDRCRIFFFSSLILAHCQSIKKAYDAALQCIKFANNLKHTLWYSAARLVLLHTCEKDIINVDEEELKWILDNIEYSLKDVYPISMVMMLELLEKSGIKA